MSKISEAASLSHDTLIGYVTAPSIEVAQNLAENLLKARLVACVNVVNGVESIYRWEGSIERGSEVLMILKTSAKHQDAIAKLIHDEHPYDVPECVFTTVVSGYQPYLQWIHRETSV